jgi:hypothetical protein
MAEMRKRTAPYGYDVLRAVECDRVFQQHEHGFVRWEAGSVLHPDEAPSHIDIASLLEVGAIVPRTEPPLPRGEGV